ncbi:MAG: YkgJ family cysteine cluster protein [Candidatus Dojkabacteria bacterium]
METFSNSPCYGCGGQCCKDMMASITKEELETFKIYNTIFILDTADYMIVLKKVLKGETVGRGIYVWNSEEDGLYDIIISGSCENLNQDGMCNIHEIRPDMCKSFPADAGECLSIRKSSMVNISDIK